MYDEIPRHSILYADAARGVYIPQFFAKTVVRKFIVNREEMEYYLNNLSHISPDSEYYWEFWDTVLRDIRLTITADNRLWGLYQDGDLWVVPATYGRV